MGAVKPKGSLALQREPVNPPEELEDVWGDGTGRIWAAGFQGISRRVAPGLWEDCPTGSKAFFKSIHGGHGLVVAGGYPHNVAISKDGVKFRGRNVRARKRINLVRVLASGRIVAIPELENRLVFSDDGGKTFEDAEHPHHGPDSMLEVRGTLYLPYGDEVLCSRDEGLTWKAKRVCPDDTVVQILEGDDGLVVVSRRGVWRWNGNKAAEAWRRWDDEETGLRGGAIGEHPWVVVGDAPAQAWVSEDRGQTWTPENVPGRADLEAVWSDGQGIIAVGDDGLIVVSPGLRPPPTDDTSPAKPKAKQAVKLEGAPQAASAWRDPRPCVAVATSNPVPASTVAHAAGVSALALHGDALATGDADGVLKRWQRRKGTWHVTETLELGAAVGGLAFFEGQLWAVYGDFLLCVDEGEGVDLPRVGHGLLARGSELVTLCPPQLVGYVPQTEELTWADLDVPKDDWLDLRPWSACFDHSVQGERWVVDTPRSGRRSGTRVWGEGCRTVQRLHVKSRGGVHETYAARARFIDERGEAALTMVSNRYAIDSVKFGRSQGKTGIERVGQPHADTVTVDLAHDTVAWIDHDEALSLASGSDRPVVFFRKPEEDHSLGGSSRDVEFTERVFSKHRIVTQDRTIATRLVALDGETVVTGDALGEVCVFDTPRNGVAVLGPERSVVSQPPCSDWIYRGRVRASTADERGVWIVDAEGVLVCVDPSTGQTTATPVRVDAEAEVQGLIVVDDTVVVRAAPTWLGYRLSTGEALFRTPVHLEAMMPLEGALYGFESHGAYVMGERAGHAPFRLDLTTGELVELVPPTPPGASDNAGWDLSDTMLEGGLLCSFDYGTEDDPAAARSVQSVGKNIIAGPDASLLEVSTFVWNPVTDGLTPVPERDAKPGVHPHFIGHPTRVAPDRRTLLFDHEPGWTIRDTAKQGWPIVAEASDVPYAYMPVSFDVAADEMLVVGRYDDRAVLCSLAGEPRLRWRSGIDTRYWASVYPAAGFTALVHVWPQAGVRWVRIR